MKGFNKIQFRKGALKMELAQTKDSCTVFTLENPSVEIVIPDKDKESFADVFDLVSKALRVWK